MYLIKTEIYNFRNYAHELFLPDQHVNLITGRNAQGKTNLLEAIYVGTAGNTFRTNRFTETINRQSENTKISYLFNTAGGTFSVFFELNSNGKKLIMVDGQKVNPGKSLPFPAAIVFTPDDLDIVKGSPARRRKYIDFELGLLDFSYRYYYQQYQKALYERNNLLKRAKSRNIDNDLLEIWNHQLIDTGSRLIYKRLQLLKKLVPLVKDLFLQLTGGGEGLEIKYYSSLKISLNMEYDQISNLFFHEIAAIKAEECARGLSLKGPHRDELIFYIDSTEARQYGSRGQQRTIVLALKLALIELWKKETDDYPILLLDDVLQELDAGRQSFLFKKIQGQVQTFITTSSEREIKQFSDNLNNVIKVAGGKLGQEE